MFILNYYSSSNFVYVQKIFRSKLVSFTPGGTITRCWSSATCSEPWTMKNREVCAQPAIQHLNENIKRFQDTRIKVDKIQWERNAVYNAYSLLPTANDLKWHISHTAYDCTGPVLRLYSWLLSSDLSSKQFGPRRCHDWPCHLARGQNEIKRSEKLGVLEMCQTKHVHKENGHFWCQRFLLSSFEFQAKDRRRSSITNKALIDFSSM